MPQVSIYANLWHKLKTEKKVIIKLASPHLREKIITALRKRRHKDTAFQFQQSEAGEHWVTVSHLNEKTLFLTIELVLEQKAAKYTTIDDI